MCGVATCSVCAVPVVFSVGFILVHGLFSYVAEHTRTHTYTHARTHTQYTEPHGDGVLMVSLSAILTRHIDTVTKDMDDATQPMVGMHGYASMVCVCVSCVLGVGCWVSLCVGCWVLGVI